MGIPANCAKAKHVKTFISQLKHTKSEFGGKQFDLLPWEENIIDKLFDTVDENGWRKYRYVYVEIPKKNGKTCLGAALALFMLCADGEEAAEVYSAAAEREQAGILYRQAEEFVNTNKSLEKKLILRNSTKRISYPKKNGFYQVLSSESFSKHGLNPSAVFFDELHAQPNDELWRVLTSGTDYARRQQLIFVMTTAGVFDVESIWWKIRSKAIQISKGVVKQDDFLPVLYIADPEKDSPDDEELWKRVNPSLGQIFSLDKIRKDYNTAKQDPVDFEDFKRFRLNIPIKQISRWMPMDDWDKCGWEVVPESLLGLRCYGGLDMSTKIDLTAFVLVFPKQTGLDVPTVLCKFYCPQDTIMQRSRSDRVHYEIWEQQGFLVATPGNVIDEEFVLRDVVAFAKDHNFMELGFDPWAATSITTKLVNDHGITCVEMRQGSKTLSEPAKSLLSAVKRHSVNHGGHPVLRWNADNLVMVSDANENVRPAKDKATDRIDGIVALIMAWGRMILQEQGDSVYEERGVTILE